MDGECKLGKATRRGTKRCVSCGTINGTRGSNCKNKKCNINLRDKGNSQQRQNATKLITDSPLDLYSIKLSSPFQRGFVQLPILQELDCDSAKCYVSGCYRNDCDHVKLSNECTKEAQILKFKSQALDSIKMLNEDIKTEILHLAYNTCGPLAQRVNKSNFVVKCSNEEKFPFGFLHVNLIDNRFLCSCSKFSTEFNVKCIHFYAIQAVFLSDDQLAKEYRAFLSNKNETSMGFILKKQIHILSKDAIDESHQQNEHENSNEISTAIDGQSIAYKCKSTSWSFDDWFSNMIEQISGTLCYENKEPLQELVFNIPHIFFESLKTKILSVNEKIRLPNHVQEIQRNERPPFGTFTKHTWELNNFKNIFGNSLAIKRFYERLANGSLRKLRTNETVKHVIEMGFDELFIIEWIPNIYEKTHVGELKLRFMIHFVQH